MDIYEDDRELERESDERANNLKYVDMPNGILEINEGIIVHQVNCRNRIGAGISGVICKKYPIVEKNYHLACEGFGAKGVFGTIQEVPVTDKLTIVNMFSQFNFGNPKKTGKRYTDYNAFVDGLTVICNKHPNENIYISEYIGCGFGGGDWNTLCSLIQHLPITIVKQPDYIAKTYKACK